MKPVHQRSMRTLLDTGWPAYGSRCCVALVLWGVSCDPAPHTELPLAAGTAIAPTVRPRGEAPRWMAPTAAEQEAACPKGMLLVDSMHCPDLERTCLKEELNK